MQEKEQNIIFLNILENQIVEQFSSDSNLIDNLQAIRHVSSLTKQYDEAEEKYDLYC